MKTILGWVLGIVALGLSQPSPAQEPWPARSIRFIVPSAAGGGTDYYARALAPPLSEALKQQVVVENRPGASGNVGAEAMARSAPDGYTFLVSADPALTVNPNLYKNLPYNAERDFEPVARGVAVPLVLVAHPSLGVKSLQELIALAKREPGTISFGSSGPGAPNHLALRMIEEASGAKFLHVPFNGLGQSMPAFLGGQIKLLMPDVALALPQVKAGKMVPLAINFHSPQMPSVPTIQDSGFPDITVPGNFSVVTRAGTPAAIVQRMNGEINRAMKNPALASNLEAHGFVPQFDTPEEFAAKLQKERAFWGSFIRRAGIVPD